MGRIAIMLLTLAVAFSPARAQVARRGMKPASAAPPASLEGKTTVYMAVGGELGTFPLFDVEVYLFTLEQSKPLRELQHRCKHAMRRSGVDATAIYEVCAQSQVAAADIIPRLPRLGFTRTDRNGAFRFGQIPSGQRYQVVGIKFEGGEPVIMVGSTPRLKPGENCTVNLSENDSWVDALPENP